MRFPTIKMIASELRGINRNVEGECDVRLCVWDDGAWIVRHGLVDYDPSHSPMCGASSVPGCGGPHCRPQRFDSTALARELLEQVKDQYQEIRYDD